MGYLNQMPMITEDGKPPKEPTGYIILDNKWSDSDVPASITVGGVDYPVKREESGDYIARDVDMSPGFSASTVTTQGGAEATCLLSVEVLF